MRYLDFNFVVRKVASVRLFRVFALSFAFALSSPAQTDTLVVPREAADRDGSRFANPLQSVFARTQQIYASSEFSNAQGNQVAIQGIAFRLDKDASSLNAVIPIISLQMATYSGSMLSITRNSWDETLVNPTTVFSRQNLPLTAEPGLGFNIRFIFDQPYVYDRNSGHLVLRINSNGAASDLDFEHSGQERGAYLFYFDPFDPAVSGGALVTEFTYTVVPEPATWLVLFAGLAMFVRRGSKAKT